MNKLSPGHCNSNQSFGHLLTPMVDFSDAQTDVQWHKNSSGEPLHNLVWIGNNTWVPITGLMWRAGEPGPDKPVMYVGQTVCRAGMNFTYRCAVIDTKSWSPGFFGGIDRSNVFIRVYKSSPIAGGGDSGGPWIGNSGVWHNAAFGVHAGTYAPDAQGIYRAFFTPTDFIYTNGFSVFTNCAGYYC